MRIRAVPALIITQSRGQWLALLVAVFLLFLAGRAEYRRRFAVAAVGVIVVLSLVAVTVAGDKIDVVTSGLLGRWSTIRTSTTQDISLLSRIYEGEAVLTQVVQNPVLGHGLGVPYSKYDIITQEIWTSTWIHNGYLGLLYTYGIWGTILMSIIFASAIRRGYRAYLKPLRVTWQGRRALLERQCAAACSSAPSPRIRSTMLTAFLWSPFQRLLLRERMHE